MKKFDSRRFLSQTLCVGLCAALALTGCQTTSNGGSGSKRSYAQSCGEGAIWAAGALFVYDLLKNGKSGRSVASTGNLVKAAALGCTIGLAASAVGKLIDSQQQARAEEAMKRDAKRRAMELQQYAAIEQRYQAMPARTPQQQARRDEALENAREEWLRKYQSPVTVDLGQGATSTITPEPPPFQTQSGLAKPGATALACVDYTHLVQTPAGSAKQLETWCPDKSGQMVRVATSDELPA